VAGAGAGGWCHTFHAAWELPGLFVPLGAALLIASSDGREPAAIGQNAVSVVVLPGDVALLKAEHKEPRVKFRRARPMVRPSDDEMDL
jgi:hypothetical protein